jgi:hypothetical protein
MNEDLILRDRPFYNQILDLDKSTGDCNFLEHFRFIKNLGRLYEQVSCDLLTGDATFQLLTNNELPLDMTEV